MTASLASAGKTVVEELNLKVFSTGLATVKNEDGESSSNEEEIKGSLSVLSKGDAVSFNAVPNSGATIPGKDFRIILEGTTKNSGPIVGLQVSSNDGYFVPIETGVVSARIFWQDPKDQSIQVQIFPTDGKTTFDVTPGPKKPRISCDEISRIQDPKQPMFFVSFDIKKPTDSLYSSANIRDVKVKIKDNNGKGSIKGYQVKNVGEPKFTNGKWVQSFVLEGGQIPLKKNTNGTIEVQAFATLRMPNGEVSKEAKSKACKLNVVY
jgi:hypothetical protein